MRSLTILGLSVVFALAAFMTVTASDHSGGAYLSFPVPASYGLEGWGYPVEADCPTLTFTHTWPDPRTLTSAECYIIAGSFDSERGPMPPWSFTLGTWLALYYAQHDSLPDVLTAELIRNAALSGLEPDQYVLDLLKSPITGDYPRLDAAKFARGQVYARALTLDEMERISKAIPRFSQAWFDHETFDADLGRWVKVATSPPLFIRFYGESGVIDEWIYFATVPVP